MSQLLVYKASALALELNTCGGAKALNEDITVWHEIQKLPTYSYMPQCFMYVNSES